MIYVGIDIAKNTHWASAMNSDGEILLEPFSFQNNNEGFQKFISKLSNFDKQKMLIGLESTAHYGENIISYLFNLDYKIGIINPIQTSNLRKSNIRKTKNDKIDTFIFFNMFPNLKSPPKIKNAIGVAADLMLNRVVSSIVGISKLIKFLITEKIRPETPPIIRGFFIIPNIADFKFLFSDSLNA